MRADGDLVVRCGGCGGDSQPSQASISPSGTSKARNSTCPSGSSSVGKCRDRLRVYGWIGGDRPGGDAGGGGEDKSGGDGLIEEARRRKEQGFGAVKMNATGVFHIPTPPPPPPPTPTPTHFSFPPMWHTSHNITDLRPPHRLHRLPRLPHRPLLHRHPRPRYPFPRPGRSSRFSWKVT